MKLRPFELALVIIFTALAALALFILANYDGGDKNDDPLAAIGTVTIWGTLPPEGVNNVLKELTEQNESYEQVSYRYYPPDQFDDALLNALADRQGPDIVLISHEKLVDMRRRIKPISYESFPVRDIRNFYIDGAQIFALSDGLYGYPVAVDPLMMYWNRDILTTNGYLEPPDTWEYLVNTMFDDLIIRDFDRSIERSVLAMGEYSNIRNAYAVLSTLLIQGGSKLVSDDSGSYKIQLQSSESGSDPLRSAVDFYTRFSKPNNTLYSWNRSLEEDRQKFVSEDLALYFGYGSEGPVIERLNPNLNFDVVEVPQGATASVRRTYGKFYAFSILQTTDNPSGASIVLGQLASAEISSKIALNNDLVPIYRSVVNQGSNDTYGRVTYSSASIALGWLNPNINKTNNVFKKAIEDINENRADISSAAGDVSVGLKDSY